MKSIEYTKQSVECKECSEHGYDVCLCHRCTECRSKNLEAWDDGEDYPPNIKCLDCGNWD